MTDGMKLGNEICAKCQSAHPSAFDCSVKLHLPTDTTDVMVERVARALADSADMNWEALSERPDIACGHSMPEGCKSYWYDLARAAIAALATRPDPSVELMEAARQVEAWGYLWKWVERGMFDKGIGPHEALEVMAHHPSAPWKNGRWDVDHKPYAAKFYEAFPNARGEGL